MERILAIIKFGKEEHINDLVRNGVLYLNPLSYFKKSDNDDFRRDNLEGISGLFQADGAILKMEIDDKFQNVAEIRGSIKFHDFIDGPKVNLYCLHLFRESHIETLVDKLNLEFNDTFVAFKNGDVFLNQIREGIRKAGFKFKEGDVIYQDYSKYSGKLNLFHKSDKYKYQSEYRFVVYSNSTNPIKITIGDLSNFSIVGPTSDLNRRIRIVNS